MAENFDEFDEDGLINVDTDDIDDDIPEIEIVDDTPEEDRNREPRGATTDDDDDEIGSYSQKVQKRINEKTRMYHEERRAREAVERQNQEALAYAQAILAENQKLKETVEWGEKALLQQAQHKLAVDTAIAEARYKQAYEEGDSEGLVAAQRDLVRVAQEAESLKNYRPVAPNLQPIQAPVYNAPQQVPQNPRDEKAESWAANNKWFGQDREMTALAYGIHEKLVADGVDPRSDQYYAQIDATMRQRFPDKFKSNRPATVVASASRSTPSKKVTLTATQVAIAKRLGVPLEQYAKQVAKLG
jgi:hypothetical protein